MQANPFASPQPVSDEAHVVRRGRTLRRALAAVAFWVLAILWSAVGVLATLGAPDGIYETMPYVYAAILVAMFLCPTLGLVFLGLSCWRASRRWLIYAVAAFTPLGVLIGIRTFFWQ